MSTPATTAARVFEDKAATREATPLFVGIVGPSGGGKTFSALRMATGIQRVVGGDIFFIDTEARRALHYAERFRFRHVPFGAPFSPSDYLAAIEHCIAKGAKTIVIDSMSHEHEGPGGVLQMHDDEVKRMAGTDWKKAERVMMLAWQKPKAQRRRLINTLLQRDVNIIFCFRAKQKLKLQKGEDPIPLGFMPIAGEEYVYECTLKCLLLPGADGFPTWQSDNLGEKMMIKIPEQFREMFAQPTQLTEDVGVTLAKWAAGAKGTTTATPETLIADYAACSDAATFRALESQRAGIWKTISKPAQAQLKAASDTAKTRMEAAEQAPNDDPPEPDENEPRADGEDIPLPPDPRDLRASGGA